MGGNGTYVDVDDVDISDVDIADAGWVSGRNFLVENIDQQQSIVEDMHTREIAALESLRESLALSSLPADWRDIYNNVVLDPVALIDRGVPGALPVLNLPATSSMDVPILGAFKDMPIVDLDIREPEEPDAPVREINYSESTYNSDLFDEIYTRIYAGINSERVIFSEEVQAQILAQAQARQKTIRDTAWQQAIDGIGADGFDLPSGSEAGILGRLTSQFADEDSAVNRDIAIKMAELADLNVRFMTDKALALEQLLRDFHNNREERSLKAELEIARFVLDKYDKAITAYAKKWDGETTRLNAASAKVDVIYKQNQLILSQFTGELEGVKLLAGIDKTKSDVAIDGFKGNIELFKASQQEKADWWRALSEEQKSIVATNDMALRKAIAEVNTILQGTLSDNQLKTAISKDIAAIVAQILASALGAVNTGVTHSTSKSENSNISVSNSASVTESHSFEEKIT